MGHGLADQFFRGRIASRRIDEIHSRVQEQVQNLPGPLRILSQVTHIGGAEPQRRTYQSGLSQGLLLHGRNCSRAVKKREQKNSTEQSGYLPNKGSAGKIMNERSHSASFDHRGRSKMFARSKGCSCITGHASRFFVC